MTDQHAYKGYRIYIDFESGTVTVFKGSKLVHKALSLTAARKWVDKKKGTKR